MSPMKQVTPEQAKIFEQYVELFCKPEECSYEAAVRRIKELEIENKQLQALIDDDLAGCVARMDGLPLDETKSDTWQGAWRVTNNELSIKAEAKRLKELVTQGYTLSTEAACARQKCTVEYLEHLFDSVEAFQKEVPEELRAPTMKGLRPKL